MALRLELIKETLHLTNWQGDTELRPRSIPNETVLGSKLPTWERFEQFVSMVVKVPKAEADKARKDETSSGIGEQSRKRHSPQK